MSRRVAVRARLLLLPLSVTALSYLAWHHRFQLIAAYRVSHSAWSEEQALTELLRYANESRETDWAFDVVRAYCQRPGN